MTAYQIVQQIASDPSKFFNQPNPSDLTEIFENDRRLPHRAEPDRRRRELSQPRRNPALAAREASR